MNTATSPQLVLSCLTEDQVEKLWRHALDVLGASVRPDPKRVADVVAPFIFSEVHSKLTTEQRDRLQRAIDRYEEGKSRGYLDALLGACVSELDKRIAFLSTG